MTPTGPAGRCDPRPEPRADPSVRRRSSGQQLTAYNPARRFGLRNKGAIDIGYDADLALVGPEATWTVRAEDFESTQEYSPFEDSR